LKKESFAFLDGWCSLISSRVTEQQQQQPSFFFFFLTPQEEVVGEGLG
jgi:hypothetical protein